jgi:uncharacterized membrane protein
MKGKERETGVQRDKKVLSICITAVFMAFTCLATMVIQIPIPLGYAHLGDSVILITSFLFGPVVGAVAGGIGSAMADILTGYAIWAIPTLIIKAIMGAFAGYFFYKKRRRIELFSIRSIIVTIITLLFMVIGYVISGAILYGSMASGVASAPGLLMKSVVNLLVFYVLTSQLRKIKISNL